MKRLIARARVVILLAIGGLIGISLMKKMKNWEPTPKALKNQATHPTRPRNERSHRPRQSHRPGQLRPFSHTN